MESVQEAVQRVAAALAQAPLVFGHGTQDAWDEATALVLGVTGLPDQKAYADHPLVEHQQEQIDALMQRRIAQREPLAYLLGRAHYAGYEFLCEPGVVIPRSPIGLLIGAGMRPWLRQPPSVVVDVCCGTGCLGILCAHTFPEARVLLLDVDAHAVALAQRNVSAHGLEERVRVAQSDLLDALSEPVDLLVSNPPYVDAADMSSLPREYQHEPVLGLSGGADGLDVVARLLEQSSGFLSDRGLMVCEVGRSAAALQREYPAVPFVWLDLPQGGEGVFVLDGVDLPGVATSGQRA